MQQARSDAALRALFHLHPTLSVIKAKLTDDTNTPPIVAECRKLSPPCVDATNGVDDEKAEAATPSSSKSSTEGSATSVSDDEDDEPEANEAAAAASSVVDAKDSGDAIANAPANEDDELTTQEAATTTATFKCTKPKSVVSHIHECAYRLKMNVEFEVVGESGEPHNRRYALRCRLTSPPNAQTIVADGEGTSKKAAKQSACEQMLAQIAGIENDPLLLAAQIVRQKTRKSAANLNAPPTTTTAEAAAATAAMTATTKASAKDAKRKTIIKVFFHILS